MDLTDYQSKAQNTAAYPVIGHAVIYPTLGLANEAGEVAGKIKKIFRDKGGAISSTEKSALAAELGDVLWYLAQVATELELSLDDIAELNIRKLQDRQARGAIQGEGDNRQISSPLPRSEIPSPYIGIRETLIFLLHAHIGLFGRMFTDPIRIDWIQERRTPWLEWNASPSAHGVC
jgi:NTP pyrophosphatase (non-canonical NTP hydrolase)